MQPTPEVKSAALGIIEWIRFSLEAAGAVTIAGGALTTLVEMARKIVHGHRPSFTASRLELARFLALALEFQLAADVLETAISPDWTTVGHLAAIGAIRTALNYFLAREMSDERRYLMDASTTT